MLVTIDTAALVKMNTVDAHLCDCDNDDVLFATMIYTASVGCAGLGLRESCPSALPTASCIKSGEGGDDKLMLVLW